MKWTLIFIAFFGLIACKTSKKQLTTNEDTSKTSLYSEKKLISLLDSIGKLNPESWTKKLSFIVNSTLNNPSNLTIKLNSSDFQELRATAKKGELDLSFAKKIFPKLELDSSLIENLTDNKLPIGFYSFDKNENDFEEFAISIGYGGLSWENDVYFFKADKIIAKHQVFHRYGLELNHFKNEHNQTVIYYKVNYGSGSGTWWNQLNFYRYNNDSFLPTLTEIKNINLQFPWSIRPYWIESTIINTKPLKLKFVFNNQFTDTLGNQIEFINDSIEITYDFDKQKEVYIPNFTNSNLSLLKLQTYFIANNELLFVNTYYDLLKKEINGNNQLKRKAILIYLNELKNKIDK
ncbi:MAG: hypothetical protein L3J20_11905 [Flavobacteriaceae bacterium]|nr:hypothetical protein [Flavobacteriaceae bacterium]